MINAESPQVDKGWHNTVEACHFGVNIYLTIIRAHNVTPITQL
jgi:hypothetical protein